MQQYFLVSSRQLKGFALEMCWHQFSLFLGKRLSVPQEQRQAACIERKEGVHLHVLLPSIGVQICRLLITGEVYLPICNVCNYDAAGSVLHW